jgi:hypothetical protein
MPLNKPKPFDVHAAIKPAWVCWLAQDADGTWWGYECEPLQHDNGWYENEVGRIVRLGQSMAEHAWRDTLCKVTSVLDKHF